MVRPGLTPKERRDLLADWGVDPWATLLGPSQAAALESPAHVDVEATYVPGHFEDTNFDDLMIEDAYDLGLRDGVRYRVEGLLEPGNPPEVLCAGYNGPLLHPFEVEAITHARLVRHAGAAIRAYRSPGWLRDDGRGGYLEPRQSRLDVLAGCSGEVVYVAVLRALSRSTEAFAIHMPCRDVWREMFPADGPPSLFHYRECADPADKAAAVPLPGDPAAALLAIHERLIAGIQRRPDGCGADALFMAFARDGVHYLRLGGHRVVLRSGSELAPVLWEHNMRRYHQPPERELPEWAQRHLLSSLTPDARPGPVHSFPSSAGERWIGVSGGLLEHLPDEAVHGALGRRDPDDIAAWFAAEAARLPDAEEHASRREWGLVVIDTAALGPARPRDAPAALDMNSVLAQLHDLERNRR